MKERMYSLTNSLSLLQTQTNAQEECLHGNMPYVSTAKAQNARVHLGFSFFIREHTRLSWIGNYKGEGVRLPNAADQLK